MKIITDFQHQPSAAKFQQAASHLRRLIFSGHLEEGARLPSTTEMAKQMGIEPSTAHQALVLLVKEGLVARTPKRGSFVRSRGVKLRTLGVYFHEDILSNQALSFHRSLAVAISAEARKRKAEPSIWIDMRDSDTRTERWDDLRHAANERRIDGLVVPLIDRQHYQWINRLSVPVAYLTNMRTSRSITPNSESFFAKALTYLSRQGCKSVGFITALSVLGDDPTGKPLPGNAAYFSQFVGACGEHGLELRNEWMPSVERGFVQADLHEQLGYDAFLKIWSKKNRPQALIVDSDVIARGTVAAILKADVAIPKDLKLVFMKHESVPIFCPFPFAQLMLRSSEVAEALVDQVALQVKGEQTEMRQVDYHLISPEGRPLM